MEDQDYTWVVIGTTIAFFSLAALLLVPIYRFLIREEKASEAWTEEALDRAERERRQQNEQQ